MLVSDGLLGAERVIHTLHRQTTDGRPAHPRPSPPQLGMSGTAQLSNATAVKDMVSISRDSILDSILASPPWSEDPRIHDGTADEAALPRKPPSNAIVKYRQMRQAGEQGCGVWVWLLRPFP
jgi:hypothetical protein